MLSISQGHGGCRTPGGSINIYVSLPSLLKFYLFQVSPFLAPSCTQFPFREFLTYRAELPDLANKNTGCHLNITWDILVLKSYRLSEIQV